MKYLLSIFVFVFICVGCSDEKTITELETEIKFIKINSPNGGEVYSKDSTIVLSLEHNEVDSIRIFISYDGGNSWSSDITPNTAQIISSSLEVGNFTRTSDSCLFRIESSSDPKIFDVSDSLFFITQVDTTNINDTSYIKFLQFEKGNFWIYESFHYNSIEGRETTKLYRINYDEIEEINGKDYYRLINISIEGDSSFKFYRIDYSNGYLYEYSDRFRQENLLTILTSEVGKHEIDYKNYPNDFLGVTISQVNFSRFEENVTAYKHYAVDPETQFRYIFSDKYGLIDYWRTNIGGTWSRTYLGCYINSIAYGDTTFAPNE